MHPVCLLCFEKSVLCMCCVCEYLFSPYSAGPPSIISTTFFLQLSTTSAHNTFIFTGTMLIDKVSRQGKND
jgi:hypothetical protein